MDGSCIDGCVWPGRRWFVGAGVRLGQVWRARRDGHRLASAVRQGMVTSCQGAAGIGPGARGEAGPGPAGWMVRRAWVSIGWAVVMRHGVGGRGCSDGVCPIQARRTGCGGSWQGAAAISGYQHPLTSHGVMFHVEQTLRQMSWPGPVVRISRGRHGKARQDGVGLWRVRLCFGSAERRCGALSPGLTGSVWPSCGAEVSRGQMRLDWFGRLPGRAVACWYGDLCWGRCGLA